MPDVLWNLTLVEFLLIAKGYVKKVNREYEMHWNNSRIICYMIYMVNRDPKSAPVPFDKFMTAKESQKPVKWTKEKYLEVLNKYNPHLNGSSRP